jgi:hypothetical protein
MRTARNSKELQGRKKGKEMRNQKFTFTEMIIVFFVSVALLTMLSSTIAADRVSSQNMACMINLSQIGKALFMYQSPSYFDSEPYPLKTPIAKRNTNAISFVPLIALFKDGLLDNVKFISCPKYNKAVSNEVFQQSNPATGVAPLGATNYLFTYYYYKDKAPGIRVIAGDASGCSESGKGFSPNHGDQAFAGAAEGANALFVEGSVKASLPTYQVEGAQNKASAPKTPANLWDAGGVEYDAKTDTATGTQIGAYE